MATATSIQPDVSFIRGVMAAGGGDLKKCYQCATCSVVCELSPADSPFPRKQMIEAQWGLKTRLAGDPAIWLCHNCGECTSMCPRGARPGDVMSAIRAETIKHFAFPGFMGSLVASPKAWPVLLALPVLIFALMAWFAPPDPTPATLEFADMFPIPVLEALFFAVGGFVLLAMGIGLARMLAALRAGGVNGPVMQGLVPALKLIATHERFQECGADPLVRGGPPGPPLVTPPAGGASAPRAGQRAHPTRYWGHLLTLWGFAGLAFMGTCVGIGTMTGLMHTPLAMTSPWKIFANVCALVVLAGVMTMLADRFRDPVKRAGSTWFDWFFLLTLTGVVITGIASQWLRLAEVPGVTYPVYFVHLVLIFSLFFYAPYSKFAHFLYRTAAIAAVMATPKRDAGRTGTGPILKEGST